MASSTLNSPWRMLVLGMLLGQTSSGRGLSLSIALEAFQEWVNITLVPVYALAVSLYIVIQVSEESSILTKYFTTSRKKHTAKTDVVGLPPIFESELEGDGNEEGPVNMTGSYKLLKNDNFEGFLAVQGVPWALRRAADQARPTHHLTHKGKMLRIRIQGIIESETTYQIDGPPVETVIRGRKFRDTVKYLDTGDGIQVSKAVVDEDYDIKVTRRLSHDKKEITMTSVVTFTNGQEPVKCVQIFERMSPQ
eukprot:CAMPEP_0195309680 /NCGR_PEP_ID=MMETSP0707-20130614/38859_1 /TAXON_ID=33640 /ORGANISM="Asterionellopsis glacialis, Strain CCMP134" /LENGTH=249 /DNA_ID=CAMNT_0040373977 /DNA_START=32 /DNA_END=781 /DNA_ORIENTATION=-